MESCSSPERGGGPSAGWWRGTGGLRDGSAERTPAPAPPPASLVPLPVPGRIESEWIVTLRAFISTVRSEEHTSELQSLMRISYAVFCLNTKKRQHTPATRRTRSHENTYN